MTFTDWIQVFRGFQQLFSVINSTYPLTFSDLSQDEFVQKVAFVWLFRAGLWRGGDK